MEIVPTCHVPAVGAGDAAQSRVPREGFQSLSFAFTVNERMNLRFELRDIDSGLLFFLVVPGGREDLHGAFRAVR